MYEGRPFVCDLVIRTLTDGQIPFYSALEIPRKLSGNTDLQEY
jgi:hypothetical protein